MGEALQDLAARGQATRERRSKRKPKPKPPKRKPPKRSTLLTVSLRDPLYEVRTVALGALTLTPGALTLLFVGLTPAGTLLLMPTAGAAIGVWFWHRAYTPRAQLKWLYGRPCGLDPARYLRVLDVCYGDDSGDLGTMTVRVTFRSPVPQQSRQIVADAVVGACRAAGASFDADELVVLSEPLATSYNSGGSQYTNDWDPSNRKLHNWFRKLVDKGLSIIDNEYPIEELSVSADKCT